MAHHRAHDHDTGTLETEQKAALFGLNGLAFYRTDILRLDSIGRTALRLTYGGTNHRNVHMSTLSPQLCEHPRNAPASAFVDPMSGAFRRVRAR